MNAEIFFHHFTCPKDRRSSSSISFCFRQALWMPPCRVGCHIRFKHKTHILNILNETSQSNHVPTKRLLPNRCNKCVFVLTCFSHITLKLPLTTLALKKQNPSVSNSPESFSPLRGMESSSYSRWGAYGCVVKGSL